MLAKVHAMHTRDIVRLIGVSSGIKEGLVRASISQYRVVLRHAVSDTRLSSSLVFMHDPALIAGFTEHCPPRG